MRKVMKKWRPEKDGQIASWMFALASSLVKNEMRMREKKRRVKQLAAADARSTKEVENGKHTSGGVMIAVQKRAASVADTAGRGNVEGLEETKEEPYCSGYITKGGLSKSLQSASGIQNAGRREMRLCWKQ